MKQGLLMCVLVGGCTVAAVAATVAACGTKESSSDTSKTGGDAGAAVPTVDGGGGTAQTPPMGGANVEAWLATGQYKAWHCEPAIHASRSPSPHGFNHICSNDAIATNATNPAPWPIGSAAVKEMYNAATDTTPVGYAVYLKTADDTDGGSNWYWYERVPLASAVPHDANGVVADGLGGSGTANSICVGCHSAAGSDMAHTPSVGGHDEVYTPVD